MVHLLQNSQQSQLEDAQHYSVQIRFQKQQEDLDVEEFNVKSLTKIGEGGEAIVYDGNDGYVYKLYKRGVDLNKLKNNINKFNQTKIFEKSEIVGQTMHDGYRCYIVKQKKLTPLNKYYFDTIIKAFKDSGFLTETKYEDQTLITFTNGELNLYDIGGKNLGIDENGNIKLLDAGISR